MTSPQADPMHEFLVNRVAVQSTGCWEWQRYVQPNGYGQAYYDGRTIYAHRLSWLLHRGPIPDDRPLIDHLCRNRRCCNPSHLEPVNASQNVTRGVAPERTRQRFAAITHCAQGHPYDEVNTTYRPGTNVRRCKQCDRDYSNRYYAARKAMA
jgi:hypothetical protein